MTRRPASFAGIEFDVTRVNDSLRRALEITKHRNRNGARVRDHGGMARMTRCDVIFWDRPAVDGEFADASVSYRDRFNEFARIVMAGRPASFAHPGGGTYRAFVAEIDWSEVAVELDTIRGTFEFVEDTSETTASLALGSDRPQSSGLQEASVDFAEFDKQFKADLPSASTTFLDDIDAFLGEWADPTNVPEVPAQLKQAIRLIESAQDSLSILTDPQYYEIFILSERLMASLRSAAESVVQTQPQLLTATVLSEQPLRSFLVGFYGAAEAAERYDSILELNVVDDPSYLAAGTQLTLPVSDVGRRDLQGFQ